MLVRAFQFHAWNRDVTVVAGLTQGLKEVVQDLVAFFGIGMADKDEILSFRLRIFRTFEAVEHLLSILTVSEDQLTEALILENWVVRFKQSTDGDGFNLLVPIVMGF